MDSHTRRLAAAAYDRAREARRRSGDRVVLVGVDLGPGVRRTLVGDLALDGDPPEVLRAAIADTLAMLRIAWMAVLQADDEDDDGRGSAIDAVHAALQCQLAATEWTWASGTADGHALGRTLARRREDFRQAIARPHPHGAGILLPQRARASEPLPRLLVDACAALDHAAEGATRLHASLLHEVGYAAIGAWRLLELEDAAAAAAIDACIRGDAPTPSAGPEERVPLRAAS